MRGRSGFAFVLTLGLLGAVVSVQLAPASAVPQPPEHVLRYRAAFEARLAGLADAARAAGAEPAAVLDDFTIVGHADLGLSDTNGDVWIHEDHAYVGTWSEPCNGLGVKVIDVSDTANPTMIGRVAGIPGTSAEDVVVRSISTPSFTGDLLAAGIQRCDFRDRSLDDDRFGVDLWDVTDPASPEHLGNVGLATGGGGAHELDLFQRGPDVYVLAATPFTECCDLVPAGDLQIVDVTEPTSPAVVGDWGPIQEGLAPGLLAGQGSFPATLGHSARASRDGTRAYVSYWDLGVVTLDITDVTNPTFVSRTLFPAEAEGNAHSLVPYSVGGRDLLLQNDEDFDPGSVADHIQIEGSPPVIAYAAWYAKPLWASPDHVVTGRTVRPRGQGCSARDYEGLRVRGQIAMPITFRPSELPPFRPACRERLQDRVAFRAGAAAVVHDVITNVETPQAADFTRVPVRIPVLFANHDLGRDLIRARRATLLGGQPSVGFLRVFDAATGDQLASFDDAPNVHKLHAPRGIWTIHNTEVHGNIAYSSWYSNGIVAIDLSPLEADPIGDPVMVGQFVPRPYPSQGFFPKAPLVWGVFVRPSDGLVFASDMNGGLWIVRPTGDAIPDQA